MCKMNFTIKNKINGNTKPCENNHFLIAEHAMDDSAPGLSPTHAAPAPTLSQPKPKPKIIRVLTVMAYMLSVSMAAILLSIYYIFVWNGGGGGGAGGISSQPSPAPLIALKEHSFEKAGTVTGVRALGGAYDSNSMEGGTYAGGADNLELMGGDLGTLNADNSTVEPFNATAGRYFVAEAEGLIVSAVS